MCRDFDRIDDRFSPRHNSSDMFQQDMFRVARHALNNAREEMAFWNNSRGNFNLARDNQSGSAIQWAYLDMNQTRPESNSMQPTVYPWNADINFNWMEHLPDNLTFLESGTSIGQTGSKVEAPAQVRGNDEIGPVPLELVMDLPGSSKVVETPKQPETPRQPETAKQEVTVPQVTEAPKQVEVPQKPEAQPETPEAPPKKEVAETKPVKTQPQEDEDVPVKPLIRKSSEKTEDSNFSLVSNRRYDRGSGMDDMRDLRQEIAGPPPSIEYQATALEAYQKGLAEKKPIVLIVGEDWCQWCKELEKELAKPEFQKYSQKAIFAKVQPSKDNSAKAIADALEIKNYPAITILEPNAAMIEERGRLVGYMDVKKLDGHMQKLLDSKPTSGSKPQEILLASVEPINV